VPKKIKPKAQPPAEVPEVGTIRPPFPIPIVLNLNPAISSLSPVGAVVGTSGLTLTVFGTQFNSGSAILWNQSSRTTSFVSATQLTATITAADLAAVGTANVTVSNPGLVLTAPAIVSNAVAFAVIPNIIDIINQLKSVTANPPTILADLQTYVTIQQSQIDTLTTTVSSDQTDISNLKSQISNLQNQVTQQQNEIATLTAEVAAPKSQSAPPLDVAQSFKSVLDQIQQAALNAGGLQTTVSNMNVQIKALVSVQPATATTPAQATLLFPDPTALPDPNHLSTLTLSFGAIPNLKAAAITGPSGSSSSSSSGSPSSSSSVSSSSSSSGKPAVPPPVGGSPVPTESQPAPARAGTPPGTKTRRGTMRRSDLRDGRPH
jgi:hypothetical protein